MHQKHIGGLYLSFDLTIEPVIKYEEKSKDGGYFMDWTCNYCGWCDDGASPLFIHTCKKCGKRGIGNPYGDGGFVWG